MAYSIKGKGKFVARKRRHLRLRKKINGTPERPRLVVTRSNRHMVAQVIDDTIGHTLVSASDIETELAGSEGTKTDKARKVGALIAERAKAAGISAVVFDRGGNKNEYIERVVTINRVSKVVKGGRRFSFTALVVVGDGEGTVGVGYGKAKEVPQAISKGVEEAKKNFFRVPMIRRTITHVVQGRDTAGIVLLRPAAPGTGVIAGGPVRAVLEAAGVHDVLTKSLGSSNAINIVHATVDALKQLEQPEAVAARRGLPLERVAPASMLRARAEGEAEKRAAAEAAEADKAAAGEAK